MRSAKLLEITLAFFYQTDKISRYHCPLKQLLRSAENVQVKAHDWGEDA